MAMKDSDKYIIFLPICIEFMVTYMEESQHETTEFQHLAGQTNLALFMINRQHCPLAALQYTGPIHIVLANMLPPNPEQLGYFILLKFVSY